PHRRSRRRQDLRAGPPMRRPHPHRRARHRSPHPHECRRSPGATYRDTCHPERSEGSALRMNATSALSAGDTAWILVSTALLMLMVPGLALFYGGLVRGKNSLNTMMMTLAPLGLVTVQWVVIGYSLSFSPGNSLLGGLAWWGFESVGGAPNATYAATIPHVLFAPFQAMFAVITVAPIPRPVVDRLPF